MILTPMDFVIFTINHESLSVSQATLAREVPLLLSSLRFACLYTTTSGLALWIQLQPQSRNLLFSLLQFLVMLVTGKCFFPKKTGQI